MIKQEPADALDSWAHRDTISMNAKSGWAVSYFPLQCVKILQRILQNLDECDQNTQSVIVKNPSVLFLMCF